MHLLLLTNILTEDILLLQQAGKKWEFSTDQLPYTILYDQSKMQDNSLLSSSEML